MSKYTYKDIIIDPTSEEAKNCIGKMVYFADNPTYCLDSANNNDFCEILQEIKVGDFFPFILKNGDTWGCIILKKEKSQKDKPKEYIPFKNSGEFINEFEMNTPIMHIYGLWVYEKIGEFDERVPRLVTEMWGDGVVVGSDSNTTKWKELLERFVFENNEPCGKLQEIER